MPEREITFCSANHPPPSQHATKYNTHSSSMVNQGRELNLRRELVALCIFRRGGTHLEKARWAERCWVGVVFLVEGHGDGGHSDEGADGEDGAVMQADRAQDFAVEGD